MKTNRAGRRPGKIGCGTWLVGLILTLGVLSLVNAPRPGRGPSGGPPTVGTVLPARDADGNLLRAGDVVRHVNDHGSPTVAVRYGGESIRVANGTRSTLSGGVRRTDVPGVVLYEARVEEGEHVGKVVTCSPRALRLAGRGQ